jgi:putative transposase
MSLYKNDNFRLPDGRTYVLLGSSDDGLQHYFIDKYAKKGIPEERDAKQLEEQASPLPPEGKKCLAEKSIRKAEENWARIRDIVNDPLLMVTGARWLLVQSHAKAIGCSPNTILSALRKFWQHGMSEDALLGYRPSRSKVELSEGKDAKKTASEDSPRCRKGRPSSNPGRANYHANALDHEHFKDVIETYWLKDERRSLAGAMQLLHERHYFYRDGNGEKCLRPAGEHPTLRQFTTYLKKHYPVEAQLRARKGRDKFNLENRPVLGTVRDVCHGVGHIAEGDATIADVTLVSSLDRGTFIGRPSIYIMVDRESRLIIGWYVGLENPSWAMVVRAFLNIAEDKEALCHRLRLKYDPTDWVASGILPEQIYLDRGEGKSKEAIQLGPGIGVTVTNLPALRADWKAIVESRFHLTHIVLKEQVPGMNPQANAIKRRSKDYSLEASLTLEEFESILVSNFIAYNRTIMKSYPLTPDHIRDRIEPSPKNLYAHGLRTRAGQLRRFSEEALRLQLLPTSMASVDENGISVNGMCYQPEEGIDRTSWFVNGRSRTAKVKVSFDRTRVDSILVHDQTLPQGYFFAHLARESIHLKGMSLIEANAINSVDTELHSGHDFSRAQNRAVTNEHARSIVEPAKKLTAEAAKGRSKAARKADSKVAREAERNLERDASAIRMTSSVPAVEPLAVTNANVVPLNVQVVRPVSRSAALAKNARAGIFNGSMPL